MEEELDYAIDATTHGNISRFINHSCSPNLVNHQVIVESMESPLAHIGLYASMDVRLFFSLLLERRSIKLLDR
jgi:SET domain-containing protein